MNRIRIASNVDIYFLSHNRIIFHRMNFDNQEVEVIEMDGDDNGMLKELLISIWSYRFSEEEIISEEISKDEVISVLQVLIEEGLLVSDSTQDNIAYIEPLTLQSFSNNFIVRTDNVVYVFACKNEACAKTIAERLICRWGDEDDVTLLRERYKNSWQCLPCRDINVNFLQGEFQRCDFNLSTFSNFVAEYRVVSRKRKLTLQEHSAFKDAESLSYNRKEDFLWKGFISKTLSSNLVGEVKELKQDDELFSLKQFAFLSSHILPNIHHKESLFSDYQVGVGVSKVEACGKALMESLERYCCEKIPEDLVFCRRSELKALPIVNTRELATYLSCQFQFKQQGVTNDFERYWTTMHDLAGNYFFIPAEYVWYCFDYQEAQFMFDTSTNGVAAHFSFESAAISAICEVIERDAIMIWWLNRLKPPYICSEYLSDKLSQSIIEIERCGYEVLFLNLTLDLLPVVLVVARNKYRQWPYFFCGASCHYSFDIACEKAMSELSFTIWNRHKTPNCILKPESIQDPLDHERYYMNPKNGSIIEHLFLGKASEELSNVNINTLSDIVRYLQVKEQKVLLKDITCYDIERGQIDINVVRAIIPGLVPITFGNFSEPLGMQRIYELPHSLGITDDQLTVDTLLENYAPHFFA